MLVTVDAGEVALTARNASIEDMVELLRTQQARKVDVVAPASAIRAEGGLLVLDGTVPALGEDGQVSLFGYIITFLSADILNIAGGEPLLPLQTPWVSFTTLSIQAVGFGYSRPAAGLMERPPLPPGRPVLTRALIAWLAFTGLLMVADVPRRMNGMRGQDELGRSEAQLVQAVIRPAGERLWSASDAPPGSLAPRSPVHPIFRATVLQVSAGQALTAAFPGHEAGFRHDGFELHVGEASVAQCQLPELRSGRVLVADAQPVPGEVLGDPPPAGGPPAGERLNLGAEYLPVAHGRAAAEHHVGDHDAAPGAQPPRGLGRQRPLVLVSEVVQRVTGHDQVDAGRGQFEGAQVRHLGPDVPQSGLRGPLRQRSRHGGRDVDREHGTDQRGELEGHESGARAEVNAGIGGCRS